ncbi:MAG: DUF4136 domain-containing protein [Gammaproteobacteria bacterium]|nr:DUF4136 domain-containing protein [Gammaproteobacteria bacterium]MDH5304332.1 DUF4136 domain-containing protein [Gammaproteobacteria bacterium]MDH5321403.1 DUF4136 domain-containing protein [Gammaproteobacteria bacterium]
MYQVFRNKSVSLFTVFAVAVVMSGCSSQAKLRADYDDSVDFSQYRTYNYYDTTGRYDTEYQNLFTRYVKQAIDIEMQARGYMLSDAPDLLVNFNVKTADKTKVTTSPSMGVSAGGYYGYRGGYYSPWVGYGYGTETHVSQYTEGTYNIDLVDPKLKRLVWEAVGVGRITDDELENIEESVKNGVPRFFELYPFVAGDGTPRK